jgi:hypothetical protein
MSVLLVCAGGITGGTTWGESATVVVVVNEDMAVWEKETCCSPLIYAGRGIFGSNTRQPKKAVTS